MRRQTSSGETCEDPLAVWFERQRLGAVCMGVRAEQPRGYGLDPLAHFAYMAGMLTSRTRAWNDGGRFIDALGHRIFVREFEGEGVPLLLLHGYPSSSYDWSRLMPLLRGHRAVCFDFLGFGLSDKPRDHLYSLHGQADLAVEIAKR